MKFGRYRIFFPLINKGKNTQLLVHHISFPVSTFISMLNIPARLLNNGYSHRNNTVYRYGNKVSNKAAGFYLLTQTKILLVWKPCPFKTTPFLALAYESATTHNVIHSQVKENTVTEISGVGGKRTLLFDVFMIWQPTFLIQTIWESFHMTTIFPFYHCFSSLFDPHALKMSLANFWLFPNNAYNMTVFYLVLSQFWWQFAMVTHTSANSTLWCFSSNSITTSMPHFL